MSGMILKYHLVITSVEFRRQLMIMKERYNTIAIKKIAQRRPNQ